MNTCNYCGLQVTNYGAHTKTCKQYQHAVQQTIDKINNDENTITQMYIDSEFSAFDIAKRYCELITHQKTYSLICNKLKELEVFDPFRNTTKQMRQTQETVCSRYGVNNYAQTEKHLQRMNKTNGLPRFDVNVDDQFRGFKHRVDSKTKSKKHLIENNQKCYYTGIYFTDTLTENVNPNDAFKRTIDHKISVLEGYLRGMTPEDITNVDNLCFCIKYINTLKGHMSEYDFVNSGLLQCAQTRIEYASEKRDEYFRETNTM